MFGNEINVLDGYNALVIENVFESGKKCGNVYISNAANIYIIYTHTHTHYRLVIGYVVGRYKKIYDRGCPTCDS